MEIPDIRQSLLGQPTRKIEVDILEDDYQDMLRLFEDRGVEESEGFRLALLAGVAELRRQSTMSDEDEESLVKQLNRMDSAYVGMKHKAYLLALDNERMELARNGWEVELQALRRMVAQLRGDAAPPVLRDDPAATPPGDWTLEAPANLANEASPSDGGGKSLWRRITGG
ncbi:MAG: hypothetical protein U0556_16075 [Dehalococcoidia bacterium]